MKELSEDCDDIGPGNNLGELKSYVLLQMLSTKLGEQVIDEMYAGKFDVLQNGNLRYKE